MGKRKFNKAYDTSTAKIIQLMETTKNPVTRFSYREIICSRLDRLELHRLKSLTSDREE